jgi:hypothetical protein
MEHRLRVSKNRVLRRIFGPKKGRGGRRIKLHNEELHNLCTSPNIIRVIKSKRMIWAVHRPFTAEMRSAYKILVRKCER